MSDIIINLINDRIQECEVNLKLLRALRAEILSLCFRTDDAPPADPWPAAAAAVNRTIRSESKPESKPSKARATESSSSSIHSITALLSSWFESQVPGVPISTGEAFAACGVSGSGSGQYKTAQSAVARWIKRGLLDRAGFGKVCLAKPWPSIASPQTVENKYAAFRASIPDPKAEA